MSRGLTPGHVFSGQFEVGDPTAADESAGGVDEVHADRLAGEGNRTGGARIRLEHEHLPVDDGELDVHESDDAERGREPADDAAHVEQRVGVERRRG